MNENKYKGNLASWLNKYHNGDITYEQIFDCIWKDFEPRKRPESDYDYETLNDGSIIPESRKVKASVKLKEDLEDFRKWRGDYDFSMYEFITDLVNLFNHLPFTLKMLIGSTFSTQLVEFKTKYLLNTTYEKKR